MMTRERLMALASALIDLALDLTDDPVRIESYLRSLGRRAFLLPFRSTTSAFS